MASAEEWVEGARPRTLPAAVSPVLVGTGAAFGAGAGSLPRALLAGVVALALQVGVNYANDYSDGVRGTDAERVGPLRLTGSGLARPEEVRRAALVALAVAAVAGLVLVAASGAWWLLLVGALAVVAAWTYTGGPRPYGYAGLGEVSVFVFFGLVATLGTAYTQAGAVPWPAVVGAVAVGALACAILVANNLRDVPTDAAAGKHTLAVRLGAPATRWLYAMLVGLPFLLALATASFAPGALAALLAAPLAVRPVRAVLGGAGGRALVPVLGRTGALQLAYALLLGAGLAAGAPS
ncbi:1,4-dihydroxy-2-naphthoate polyprenyltransferase [Quadrisphaera sp. DSM 44207]|uniref:1,4-dihydroxy-2-naphthoate polyprenyltransferase n=1 Tax=Quadrisphaera sp. DSM 44207 TaxID=1881057 RepID=UPI00088CEB74|nr:1,4-dihydroxy-2-naphthoate polyprenyltransferase [Quadrisphaera sp. DSM 44207]SDQ15821.1 1,4-dihydroxy-2-naphthoate prenyltransferase [Quadrisphaera sp. DSM 44207]